MNKKSVGLTTAQRKFLVHHGIEIDEVFDGAGMKPKEYKPLAKDANALVVSGASPCGKFGHTLRSINGQCVQCQPSVLGFRARYRTPGEVYIAHSPQTNLVKVGSAVDAKARVKSLVTQRYGGVSDWSLEYAIHVDKAGFIEDHIQSRLSDYSVARQFFRGSKSNECREIFSCSVDMAMSAITKVLIEDHHNRLPKVTRRISYSKEDVPIKAIANDDHPTNTAATKTFIASSNMTDLDSTAHLHRNDGKVFTKCTMDIYYQDQPAVLGSDCIVVFKENWCELKYDNDDGKFWSWKGKAEGPGHYRLSANYSGAQGSLHMFDGAKIMDGFWSENGFKGMWRVYLKI